MDPLTRWKGVLEARYEDTHEIDGGGMATVYLARDLKHNRNVGAESLRASSRRSAGN